MKHETHSNGWPAFFGPAPMAIHYEPQKGKGHALNARLALARGEIILATDDDMVVAEEWAAQLVLRS